MEIEYGKPKVTIDLGDKPLVMTLDTRVADNQWRRIDVKRIGKTATVSITTPGSDEVASPPSSNTAHFRLARASRPCLKETCPF